MLCYKRFYLLFHVYIILKLTKQKTFTDLLCTGLVDAWTPAFANVWRSGFNGARRAKLARICSTSHCSHLTTGHAVSQTLTSQKLNTHVHLVLADRIIFTLPLVGTRGAKYTYCDQRVCESVCLSVCPLEYLKKHTSKFHQIFRTSDLLPWLGPSPTAML